MIWISCWPFKIKKKFLIGAAHKNGILNKQIKNNKKENEKKIKNFFDFHPQNKNKINAKIGKYIAIILIFVARHKINLQLLNF